MSTEGKVQLVATVDATPAKAGFQEVKESARDMAQSVSASGRQAGEGIKQVGEGVEPAAQKVDRSTKSIIASIQRATAAAEAGGQANSKYFEAIARQRGIGVEVLHPYLLGLDAATAKAAGLGNSVEMSAEQMNAALRGVPAQFTDIVTSIASGQQPLQVMLQQGGQLKDMFGGAGNAARALGGYVAGLINPFTLAAGGAAALAVAYYQGSKEADALSRAIIMTGNAAGASVGQLQDMAKAVAGAAGSTQAVGNEAVAAAAASGKVAASNIELVSRAAVKLNKAVGMSIQDTVDDFADLGKEPVKASEKLNEKYGYLTVSVYAQIKALEEQGKTLDAANLAQKTYADAMIGRADQVVENLGYIEAAWKGIAEAAAAGWDAIAGVGRKQSDLDRIGELRQKMAPGRGVFAGISDDDRQELAVLEAKVKKEGEEAAAKAENRRQTQAGIALANEADKNLSKQEQKRREILKLQNLYIDAVKGETKSTAEVTAATKQLETALAGVEERYKEREKKPRQGKSQEQKDAEELTRILDRVNNRDVGLDPAYYTDLQKLFAGYAKGKLTLDEYRAAVEAMTKAQKFHTDQVKADEKARTEQQKAWDDYWEQWRKHLGGLDQEANKLEEQVLMLGATKSAIAQVAVARAEETLQNARSGEATADFIAQLEKEVELRKRIAAATAQQEVFDANRKAAEKAQQEWQRVSDDIGRSLTDAIFSGGKSGWDLLKKTIETTVIRATVQPAITQTVGGLLQSVGMGGGSSAGGSGLFGTLSNLSSLGSASSALGGTSAYTGGAGFLQLGSMASSFSTGLSAAAGGADLSAAIAAYEAAGMSATAGSLSAGASAAGMLGGSAGAVSGALSMMSAAAPYLAVALIVAQQLGAFKGATYHKGGAYLADTSGGGRLATDANFGNFNLGWGAYRSDRVSYYDDATKAISVGLAAQIASSVAAYGGKSKKLTVGSRFASDNDDWSEGAIRVIDAAGKTVFDFSRRYTKNAGEAMEQFSKDAARALVGALRETDLNDAFDALFDSVDPLTASLEDLNTVMGKAATITEIFKLTSADMSAAANDASLSAAGQFFKASDAIKQLAASGGLAFDQLKGYAQSYYDAQLNLMIGLNNASKSVSETLSGSVRNIKYGLLDDQGKYSMLDREAAQSMSVLKTLTDPDLITTYVNRLNETLNQAYALVPDGLKEDQAQQFIDRFTQVETLAQSRIDSARQQALDDQKEMATSITNAIITAFGGVAPAIEAAAEAIPKTITIDVTGAGASGARTELGY